VLTTNELLAFLQRATRYPVEYDPEWDSPCRAAEPDLENHITWRPVAMPTPTDLRTIDRALGGPIHPDAATFYSSFFAGPVVGTHSGHAVSLMTVWNTEDLERRLHGILEHVGVQLREGLAPTIPIANTDSDVFFSLDNDTGAVVLQDFGRTDVVVADSLAAFLGAL
jgi:hypothetical protein